MRMMKIIKECMNLWSEENAENKENDENTLKDENNENAKKMKELKILRMLKILKNEPEVGQLLFKTLCPLTSMADTCSLKQENIRERK